MKKSDMTFSPYQLELLGDFYRSNFSVSRFAPRLFHLSLDKGT